ncbi:hypothetical protein HK104_002176 [Borealophlyctis nickersoniae]|nr:hypothetical protein HK104_002176 [Borealophlyctis nickersoniae]
MKTLHLKKSAAGSSGRSHKATGGGGSSGTKKRMGTGDGQIERKFNPLDGSPWVRLEVGLPEIEDVERMHIQHYMMKFGFQGNYCAPIKNLLKEPGVRVLDAACAEGGGDAIWAIDMAREYPTVEFTATDSNPAMLPTNIPPNLRMHQHEVTQPIPYPTGTFDYVHTRNMILSLRTDDWPKVIKELARVVKPGGYIEFCEPEWRKSGISPAVDQITATFNDMIASRGADVNIANHIGSLVAACPLLTDVHQEIRTFPHYDNPGNAVLDRLARFGRQDIVKGIEALKPLLVARGQMSLEDFDAALEKVDGDLRLARSTYTVVTVYARRI